MKTAVRRIIEKGISKEQKFDLANEFQTVICECLINKVELAINSLKVTNKINNFILTGELPQIYSSEENLNYFAKRKVCLLLHQKKNYAQIMLL